MALDDNYTRYIWGVRIYLDTEETQDTDIGLYTSGGTSELRWVQNDSMTLPIGTWKTDFIIKNSFGSIEIDSDLRWGGGIEEIGGTQVSVDNTGNGGDSLSKKLQDLQMDLKGLRAEIWRFDGSGGGVAVGTVRYYGEVSDTMYTDTIYTINLESTQYKRVSNLSSLIDGSAAGSFPNASDDLVGKAIPITFGQFDGIDEKNLARMQRTANKEDIWDAQLNWYITYTPETLYFPIVRNAETNSYLANDASSGQKDVEVSSGHGSNFSVGDTVSILDDITHESNVIASISSDTLTMENDLANTYTTANSALVGVTPSKQHIVKFSNGGLYLDEDWQDGPDDLYVKVISGTGEGQIRKVDQYKKYTTNNWVGIKVEDYFETTLVPAGENQSWIGFYKIYRDYDLDTWHCENYINSSQVVITNSLELYTHDDDDGYTRIPVYGYDIDSSNDKNTRLSIQPKLFEDTTDNMNSFTILPITDFNFCTESDLSNLLIQSVDGEDGTTFLKKSDGIFSDYASFAMTTQDSGSKSSIYDRKSNTYYQFVTSQPYPKTETYYIVYELDLPVYPDNFTFDNVYLGIDMTEYVGSNPTGLKLKAKYTNWYGSAKTIKLIDSYESDPLTQGVIKNLPDFYYTDKENTGSAEFFTQQDTSSNITGYSYFELSDIDSKEKYNNIKKLYVMHRREFSAATSTSTTKWYQFAIIFKKTSDVKSYIYTPYRGRVYSDTWGGRKTATEMMSTPLDMLEHTIRLQNWTDTSSTNTWGLSYADTPLIDTTSNEGGFSHASLSSISDLQCARQILKESESYSDKIKESICKEFFLCSFSKHVSTYAGYEGISYLPIEFDEEGYTISGSTITLSQFIDIKSIEVQSQEDVFCQPIIRYKKNYATDEYEGLIQIKNVSAQDYDASYVIGYTGASGELMWRKARALWLYYRHIEPAPDELIESPWIRSEEVAEVKMSSWLKWMGSIYTGGDTTDQSNYIVEPPKRLTGILPYSIAADYFLSQRVKVQVSSYTNNNTVEGIIEYVSHNINTYRSTVRIILLGETASVEYYIQDTYGTGIPNDWQDTYGTGEPNDIQDSY